jgi:CO/xanthine dehydrogenase Mo-binding subunit
MQLPAEDTAIVDARKPVAAAQKTLEAAYTRPYQAHASIGPSCAVAKFDDGAVTVWSHTQGVYPDRQAIAQMLRMPAEQVRCIHVEGAGCYGYNGADDAAADAALIARAMPGRPVRVQWTREQGMAGEFLWARHGDKVSAALDSQGDVLDWDYRVWSKHPFHAPGVQARFSPRNRSRQLSRSPSTSPFLSRKGSAIATPLRSTNSRARASSITFFPPCRCASPRCGRSAPT